MKQIRTHVLVIGTGAAGLAAAVRLHALGVHDVVIVSEGLKMGTSINTGSDKQTYYKLGMYGTEPDSPESMARDLCAGGGVHGDLALVEAVTSVPAFFHLANLGLGFPHDSYGQYVGYKTDHDPKRRATSCGPYTSRDMCRQLTVKLKETGYPVYENHLAVSLLTASLSEDEKRCVGAVFVDRNTDDPANCFVCMRADHVIFACGGPGGLYEKSVYPKVHTGAIGIALAAGAKARNLPESQFGMASLKFRWNVSGSYMQVLPRFISRNPDGSNEREFLRDWFPSAAAMYDAVFLKGYQWPFAAGHLPGSSLIDLILYMETERKGRRVFLDYRSDPADLKFSDLSATTREYLEKSNAVAPSPYERLKKLNEPAIALYRDHNIDLKTEPLEIAVCAQHNNGGLAADLWWQSENVHGLYPIGEVNGSHGVTRPGGTALNAGQVGAFRAAEYIAATGDNAAQEISDAQFGKIMQAAERQITSRLDQPVALDWQTERKTLQKRMSLAGAFLRDANTIRTALPETEDALARARSCGFANANPREISELLRNESLLEAEKVYLSAILFQIESGVGSRGGSAAISTDTADSFEVHPALPWKFQPEDTKFRNFVQETIDAGPRMEHRWVPCRPIPECDGWFERIWQACRTRGIYGKEPIR